MSVDPRHDLRHRPEPGGRMRDSLFWQTVLPDERLAVQVYLFVTGSGATGYNVAVWGDPALWGAAPVALVRGGGRVADEVDFDDFALDGIRVRNLAPLHSSTVTVRTAEVTLDLAFEGVHEAFSFRDNPDGLPSWFAEDRIEQTGRVSGTVSFEVPASASGAGPSEANDRAGSGALRRTVALGPLGHRDHSWGLRDWSAPQHWKWLVASTPSGRAVNGWIWQARGDWGFAGFVLRGGRAVAVLRIEQTTEWAPGLRQTGLTAVLHDVEGEATHLELDVFGLLELPDERSGTIVLEGACTATIDGEAGSGQFEAMWPAAYFAHWADEPGTPA